jgi:hypothetical protein
MTSIMPAHRSVAKNTVMSSAAPALPSSFQHSRRPALRPLILPTEHGGWGFLFEPLVLALALRASWSGAFVALAFVFAFLTRQPLRLALQDALRGRAYPRTRYCWSFALGYGSFALLALAFAVRTGSWALLVPLGLVAPLGLMQVFYDAHNRSRMLLAELGGAVAMCSSAAAIAIAGGMRLLPALALSGFILARTIPTIVYVRTLLRRAHGMPATSHAALALHALAVPLVALFSSRGAVLAMAVLFARAAWYLSHEVPPAKRIGWTEIAFGTFVVACGVLL